MLKKVAVIILILVIVFLGYKLTKGENNNPLNVEANNKPATLNVGPSSVSEAAKDTFLGEKGTNVRLENNNVLISANEVADGKMHFFNSVLPDGKTVYFFLVKDQNGVFHAAANACEVCFGAHKGFHQDGNEVVCDNCGNRYPLEKIATEKGGCNPGPINPDLKISNGNLTITLEQLTNVEKLFS
jgi:uncharacterized membrane protein